MSASPRSAVLAAADLADTAPHVLLTCPDGNTIIVKSAQFMSSATGSTGLTLWLFRPSTSVTVFIFNGTVTQYQVLNTQVWFVLEPGDQIRMQVGATPASIWISGSVMQGVPPI